MSIFFDRKIYSKILSRLYNENILSEVMVMKKFAFIGAGSLQFTSKTVKDLLTFDAFKECEIVIVFFSGLVFM